MVSYAVIPTAGLGTRVLPASKEVPKEMFPIPYKVGDKYFLYPMIHVIFEKLFEVGIRNFCFVISPKKKCIEEYFDVDEEYIDMLIKLGKETEANILRRFYDKLEECRIWFEVQEKPLGVGDAVMRGEKFIGDNNFIINMGDDLILDEGGRIYIDMARIFDEGKLDGIILVKDVDDPRYYGVIIGDKISDNLYHVDKIIEKPREPVSNLAILGVYIIKPWIFNIMRELSIRGGWELTDAVQEMINRGGRVMAYKSDNEVRRIDIGRIETYIELFKKLEF